MSTFDHWMRFHVGDYLADTMHLSTFQHGLYVLLIMHYFKRGSLPEDENSLRRITKCPLRQWRSESGPVMSLFRRENESWRHPRIDATREDAQRISEKRRTAGKKGASAKWGMANASDVDGKCHDGLAGARNTTAKATNSPPIRPRASRFRKPVAEPDVRNGFSSSATDDLQETVDANPDHPRRRSAAVVPIARHLVRR